MNQQISFLIGVDGGGTGTRAVIADLNAVELARGTAGASGLRYGADFAWNSVMGAVASGFKNLGQPCPSLEQLAIGLGLAGVINKQWASNFIDKNPGFGHMELQTDSYTTLLGAHRGQPGAIIALGTGTCGESLDKHGLRRETSGWGFPFGDEASGAWLGWHGIVHLQHALDGRTATDEFSDAILQHCGGNKEAVFNWLASATQASYAQLAPTVVSFAKLHKTEVATEIMRTAAEEVVKIAKALDPSDELPLALCGGLAHAYIEYLPEQLTTRLVEPSGDSVSGALFLIKKKLENQT